MHTSTIVTFYSYRGGVGRTMALLNVGCVLAQQRRRVLMVDLDLEAPGLTHLIQRQDLFADPEQARSAKGMVDILGQFLKTPQEFAFSADRDEADLPPFLAELTVPKTNNSFALGGTLHLLPAGRRETYDGQLDFLHRNAHRLAGVRQPLSKRIRQVLLDSGQFDYILVDSRTGLSDEGYIAGRYLCDCLVLLTGLNDQNMLGTLDFLRHVAAWKEAGEGPKRIALVASPVPEHEDRLKRERLDKARERIQEVAGKDADFAVSLPYHPVVSLYEELMVDQFPDSALSHGYHRIAAILRSVVNDAREHWVQRAINAFERDQVVECQEAFEELAAFDHEQARVFAQQIAGLLGHREGKRATAMLPLLDNLAAIDPESPLHPLQAARLKHRIGLPKDDVLALLDRAQSLADRNHDETALAAALEERARTLIETDPAGAHAAASGAADIYGRLEEADRRLEVHRLAGQAAERMGDYDTAWAHHQEVCLFYENADDRQGLAIALHAMAHLDMLRGDYATARGGFGEALRIQEEIGDEQGIVVTLHGLAQLDRLQGRYEDARAGFSRVRDEAHVAQGGHKAMAVHGLAELDRLQGRHPEACRGFEEALAVHREWSDKQEIAVNALYLAVARAQSDASLPLDELCKAVGDVRALQDAHLRARASLLLGTVLRTRGCWQEALQALDEALDEAGGLGLRGIVAEAQAERALCLAATEDREQARRSASEAIEFFDEQSVRHPPRNRLEEISKGT